MFVVMFEVRPKPERRDDYLALAARLRPELEAIDGFLSVERFPRVGRPGELLSFSLWRDQAAVIAWREHGGHRLVQTMGRSEIFSDYRLRVGEIVDPSAPGATMGISEGDTGAAADGDFDSLTRPGHWLRMGSDGDRLVRIARDYGLYARAQAPPFHPPLPMI